MSTVSRNVTTAGRDIYDIHHFLFHGLPWNWNAAVIHERTENTPAVFFPTLYDFIEKRVMQTIIDQDLNTLLPQEEFTMMRMRLKQETLILIRDASASSFGLRTVL